MTDTILRDLYADATPPPDLRRRVVRALTERGLLRRRLRVGPMAAALVMLALGFALGSASARFGGAPPAPAEGDRFALFLYVGESFAPARAEAELVEEYRDWARRLRSEGHMELGERLDDAEQLVGPAVAGTDARLTGMFIIRAESPAQAEAISRGSPHARYGGTIMIRRIPRT